MGGVFYNENDPYPAKWLENLGDVGLIAKGTVSTDDIRTIKPERLSAFQRCHFFAGIGVWEYALQQAGWPHGWEVWTGSCPCQPFSGAGKRGGFADERHLWPIWFDLIRERRPGVILGEQVASPDGYAWFDHVQADMESLDYACGAVVTPTAGYGAPHGRQRLYFSAIRMAYAGDSGRRPRRWTNANRTLSPEKRRATDTACNFGGLDNAACVGHRSIAGPVNGFWRAADWLFCRDGKWRPVRPGTFPLAHGSAARVGRLRAYGNAVVAPQAIEFIKAVISELQL